MGDEPSRPADLTKLNLATSPNPKKTSIWAYGSARCPRVRFMLANCSHPVAAIPVARESRRVGDEDTP